MSNLNQPVSRDETPDHIIRPTSPPELITISLLDGQQRTIPDAWDLTVDLHQTENLFRAMEIAVGEFVAKWVGNTDYLTNPSAMAEFLYELNALVEAGQVPDSELGRFPGNYEASLLAYFVDMQNDRATAANAFAAERAKPTEVAIAPLIRSVGTVSADNQPAFIQAPELAEFRHYLELAWARSPHTLNEQAEEVMIRLYSPAYMEWVESSSRTLSGITQQVILPEAVSARIPAEELEQIIGKPKTFAQLRTLCIHKDPDVRTAASAALVTILAEHRNAAIDELNAILNYRLQVDTVRKYQRPDSETAVKNDISTQVIDALASAVSSRNEVAHRFYALKAAAMNVGKINYDERNFVLGEVATTYSFQEAVLIISEVLESIDPVIREAWEQCVTDGRIDIFSRPGKSGGAYAFNENYNDPQYLMVNWTGSIADLLTLAHEFGHWYNYQRITQTEKGLNASVPTIMAEVASTFVEDRVQEALLGLISDPRDKFTFLMAGLDASINNTFRQIACYRFEYELHQQFRQKGKLKADDIVHLFKEHMAAYMGDSVEQNGAAELFWVYWPHLRQVFYTPAYASGIMIAKSMGRLLEEDPQNLAKIHTFFATGRSKSPIEITRALGIDIEDPSFWEAGVNAIEEQVRKAEELAKTLGMVS